MALGILSTRAAAATPQTPQKNLLEKIAQLLGNNREKFLDISAPSQKDARQFVVLHIAKYPDGEVWLTLHDGTGRPSNPMSEDKLWAQNTGFEQVRVNADGSLGSEWRKSESGFPVSYNQIGRYREVLPKDLADWLATIADRCAESINSKLDWADSLVVCARVTDS